MRALQIGETYVPRTGPCAPRGLLCRSCWWRWVPPRRWGRCGGRWSPRTSAPLSPARPKGCTPWTTRAGRSATQAERLRKFRWHTMSVSVALRWDVTQMWVNQLTSQKVLSSIYLTRISTSLVSPVKMFEMKFSMIKVLDDKHTVPTCIVSGSFPYARVKHAIWITPAFKRHFFHTVFIHTTEYRHSSHSFSQTPTFPSDECICINQNSATCHSCNRHVFLGAHYHVFRCTLWWKYP